MFHLGHNSPFRSSLLGLRVSEGIYVVGEDGEGQKSETKV